MVHFELLLKLSERVSSIQSILNFDKWDGFPQFETTQSLGRVALISSILCTILGMNVMLFIQLALLQFGAIPSNALASHGFLADDDRLQMALQWTIYLIFLCAFHLGEFFTTALFNPSVATADSFMVNHSKAYTTAAMLSWIEFALRILLFPKTHNIHVFLVGLCLVVGGQICRTWAMVTCGESFNHYIQRDKKESHVLVTHGIYSVLRHPSYVGFFYWAIGTQLLLCNPLSTILYGLAAWTFFSKRIVYEEGTLRALFPGDYENYSSRTYIGIPLIHTLSVNSDDAKGE